MADDGKVIELTATAGPRASGERDSALLERGQGIGRYMIVDQLGQGGMGIVYAAYDPDLDRRVAIKVLRRSGSSSSRSSRTRLLREARAMAKLHHPNVVTVYEVGTVGDQDFVAMQYIDGSSLSEWLGDAVRRATVRQIIDAFVQAGRGLAAAHTAGLIHRDFKPANVLVDSDGRVRVSDFGLAQLLGDDAEESSAASASNTALDGLTRTGATMGTPAYMAPEQYLGGETDERTDQFSFCVALYEALYGERPFAGDTYDELRASVTAGVLRDEPAGADVPSHLRKVLARGLSADPEQRFPDMEALLAELARKPRRVGWYWAIGIGVVLVGVGLAMYKDSDSADKAAMCDAGDQLAGVWDDGVEADIRGAFDRARVPDDVAERALKGFSDALDGYAQRWRTMHTASCVATRVDKTQSEADWALRTGCLQEKRDEIKALTDVFRRADEFAVEQAAQAARGLSRLDECADIESLRAGFEPPPEDERDAVIELRADLSEVKALDEAGQNGRALALAQEALRRARDIGYKPTLAEALRWVGSVQTSLGAVTEARAALAEAILVAEEAGHLRVRAQAMISMTKIAAVYTSRPEEARLEGRRASAAIKSYGGDKLMEGELDELLALTDLAEKNYEAAHDRLQRVAAVYKSLGEQAKYAHVLLQRGHIFGEQLAFRDALERFRDALVIYEIELGRDHPETVRATESFAAALRAVGSYDTAREYFSRAEAFWVSERGRAVLGDRARDEIRTGNRVLRGRVVSPSGEPVAKAEVVAGKMIFGDAKYMFASGGGVADATMGVRRTLTRDDGTYELTGVSEDDLLIGADHWSLGRSRAMRVPEGKSPRTVDIALSPAGSVSGTVTISGRPAVGAVVVVAEMSGGDERAGVQAFTDAEGRYRFDGIAAGDYDIFLVKGADELNQDMLHSSKISVAAGAVLERDIAIDVGNIALEIDVAGAGGATIESAQVLLASERISASKGRELNAKLVKAIASGSVKSTFWSRGQSRSFDGLSPGEYTVCTVPLAGDYRDPEFMRKLAPHVFSLDVHCEPVVVAGKPERQKYKAIVPPMAPLPKSERAP
jgi:tetratricopeptide (TPR) repeat protein